MSQQGNFATTTKSDKSFVPARMDRFPWTRFHWSAVVGLGIAWILDEREAQMVAATGYQLSTASRSGSRARCATWSRSTRALTSR
jgi:hypothetical protein